MSDLCKWIYLFIIMITLIILVVYFIIKNENNRNSLLDEQINPKATLITKNRHPCQSQHAIVLLSFCYLLTRCHIVLHSLIPSVLAVLKSICLYSSRCLSVNAVCRIKWPLSNDVKNRIESERGNTNNEVQWCFIYI